MRSVILMVFTALTLVGCGLVEKHHSSSRHGCDCGANCGCEGDSQTGVDGKTGGGEKNQGGSGGCSGGSCGRPFAALIACAMTGSCQTTALAPAPAHEFELASVNGRGTYRTAEHAGKPVVVEFYFNSCPACNENASNVEDVVSAHPGAEVVEVTIDCDHAAWDSWVRRHNPSVPVLNGCDGSVDGFYNVQRFPTVVVLGADHAEKYRYVGEWSDSVKRRIGDILDGR